MGEGNGSNHRGGFRLRGARWRRGACASDRTLHDLPAGDCPALPSQGRESVPAARRNEGFIGDLGIDWRKPEDFTWPTDVRLTGLETPRQLEMLHWIATTGHMDNTVSRIKFGTLRTATMMWKLMALGHPITEVRSASRVAAWKTAWKWDPQGEIRAMEQRHAPCKSSAPNISPTSESTEA